MLIFVVWLGDFMVVPAETTHRLEFIIGLGCTSRATQITLSQPLFCCCVVSISLVSL